MSVFAQEAATERTLFSNPNIKTSYSPLMLENVSGSSNTAGVHVQQCINSVKNSIGCAMLNSVGSDFAYNKNVNDIGKSANLRNGFYISAGVFGFAGVVSFFF